MLFRDVSGYNPGLHTFKLDCLYVILKAVQNCNLPLPLLVRLALSHIGAMS